MKERETTVNTEFIAGMTTFFAMVYILMVNANMFADPFGDARIRSVFPTVRFMLPQPFPGSLQVFVAMLLLTH